MTYFLAVYNRQELTADLTQIREARLLPYQEAYAALAFPGAKKALQDAEEWLNAQAAGQET